MTKNFFKKGWVAVLLLVTISIALMGLIDGYTKTRVEADSSTTMVNTVLANDSASASVLDSKVYENLGKIDVFGGQKMADSLESVYLISGSGLAPRIAMKIAGIAYALERKFELCGCPATSTVQVKTGGGNAQRLGTTPPAPDTVIRGGNTITIFDSHDINNVWNISGDTASHKGQQVIVASTMPATVTTTDSTKKKHNLPEIKIWGGAFGGQNLGGYYAGLEIGPAEVEYRGATGGRNLRDSILRSEYSNVSGRVALVNRPNLRVSAGATGTQLYQRQLITTTASFEDIVGGTRFAGTDTLTGIVGKTAFYAGPSASARFNVGEKVSLHGDIDYQFRTGGTAEGPNGFLNGHARVGFKPFPGAILEAGAGYQFSTPVVTGGVVIDLNQIFSQN